MYAYYYDPAFIEKQKKQESITAIERELSVLDIQGYTVKKDPLQSWTQRLKQLPKKGVHTFIAIGDDDQFYELLHALFGTPNILFSFIPLFADSWLAKMMDIPIGHEACKTVSQRLLSRYPISLINKTHPFFYTLTADANNIRVLCDHQYSIFIDKPTILDIRNRHTHFGVTLFQPSTLLQREQKKIGQFMAQEVQIHALPDHSFVPRNYLRFTLPASFELSSAFIDCIVGPAHR